MSVKTVRVVDPRIQPQSEPTYATTISPKQNQYYKIPASGKSNSYITFNNLTTLGADRAYLDTFELEITATITFSITNTSEEGPGIFDSRRWTFDSFPFNKCCEEARININGGAFFSQPMSYIRAKERYWDDKKLNNSYGNVCPCNKPWLAMEDCQVNGATSAEGMAQLPTRYLPDNLLAYAPMSAGFNGTHNNDILNGPAYRTVARDTTSNVQYTVTWREPIFCSPFSSKYDETYGRPLYNITSLDLAFNMQDLGNMIRVRKNLPDSLDHLEVESYTVNIDAIQLCYQVLTIPPSITPPVATVVPYRRIVPYITDCPVNPVASNQALHMASGVYTLNEVPTAIWIFLGPTKALVQQNLPDTTEGGSWCFNKLAKPITHLSISCANTTQILNTAEPLDLYRIAKANGCKDSFTSWGRRGYQVGGIAYNVQGVGSFLRLIPGTDIVLPDQPLIPGSNANNMVFQVEADFETGSSTPENYRHYALWILFEYVGVATITPGQCEISMNPLGNGSVMATAPVVETPANTTENANTEGSGWLDNVSNFVSNISQSPISNVIGQAVKMIPGVGGFISGAMDFLRNIQNSQPRQNTARPRRRPRIDYDEDDDETSYGGSIRGGGVMSLNDFM